MTTPSTAPAPLLPDGLNPDALDTLSELVSLLQRLRPVPGSANNNNNTTSSTQTTSSQTQQQNQPSSKPPTDIKPPPPPHPHPPPSIAPTTTAASSFSSTTDPAAASSQQNQQQQQLSLKDVPAAADAALRHRFQRARARVALLPGLAQGLALQRAEIAALEARLARQRDVLARLRRLGGEESSGGGSGSGSGGSGGGGGGGGPGGLPVRGGVEGDDDGDRMEM
ncbi:RNA polymerase II transcription mediator complex subunit 9-domain-containing protein [Xylariaceae sp. FL0804]|nr:RNA polymerase II transcription mediator complex subunit 9-domain-containing protein [Xylariaceae sp. FL0804]